MISFKIFEFYLLVLVSHRLSENAFAKADLVNHHHGCSHDRCSSKSTNSIRATGQFAHDEILCLNLFVVHFHK